MTARAPSEILDTLEQAGYEAYYVGGCVRDRLLGRPVHDWDITTSAMPEDVLALFGHCVPTGIAHGTVTVLLEDTGAEVTTFRTDGSYHDGRHPDRVTFVRSLREDQARRDFTVNAMAMDRRGPDLRRLWRPSRPGPAASSGGRGTRRRGSGRTPCGCSVLCGFQPSWTLPSRAKRWRPSAAAPDWPGSLRRAGAGRAGEDPAVAPAGGPWRRWPGWAC